MTMFDPSVRPGVAGRVPPGQRLTDALPVLHEGSAPVLTLDGWNLRVWGRVRRERHLDWRALMALPQTRDVSDFHCVTGWSALDNVWEGVRFSDLASAIAPADDARIVRVYGHMDDDPYGYVADLPLETLMSADVLLAHRHNGRPLAIEHGWPVRLVVPRRYAWKSVKWLRGLEFCAEAPPGYWESRGFHRRGEPFAEQRYADGTRPPVGPGETQR